MKNTILIEVANQKALRLLHELEELELIKVVKGNLVPDKRQKFLTNTGGSSVRNKEES